MTLLIFGMAYEDLARKICKNSKIFEEGRMVSSGETYEESYECD
jgi:hypothetical protein